MHIPRFDPAFNDRPNWVDDLIAVRCCCRQLTYEAAEVFMRENVFWFDDICQARFLKQCVYQSLAPDFFANMRNLILGPYFIVPPSCATTNPSDMPFYYEDFQLAMRPFWAITRLSLILPWDLELRQWSTLIGCVLNAFPLLTDCSIDRPNVDYLLPDIVALHVPFHLP